MRIIYTPYTPCSTTEVGRGGDQLLLELRWEGGILPLAFEAYLYLCIVIGIDIGVERGNLIETTDVVLHMANDVVELLYGATFGHTCTHIQHLFGGVTIVIVAANLLVKEV